MKDNSPLFHSFLLFVFVAVLGFLTLTSGSPKLGLLRPGTRAPEPFVVHNKSIAEPITEKPAETMNPVEVPANPATEGGWN